MEAGYFYEKNQINLVFCSLIRTFELRSKILSLEKTKKNLFSFGFLLAYSYL